MTVDEADLAEQGDGEGHAADRPARRLADAACPERTCIVTRAHKPPAELIRFVLGPDGAVVADIHGKLPGRGVWVSNAATLVAEAARKRLFARAFRRNVPKAAAEAPETLAADVDRLLERDALQALSIANKAGLVVTGATKVEQAIERDTVIALFHATDGGADGSRKLGQAVTRRLGTEAGSVKRIDLFDSHQLDLALGRLNVIHAALLKGAASALVLRKCGRLADYRGRPKPDSGEPRELAPSGPVTNALPDAGQGETGNSMPAAPAAPASTDRCHQADHVERADRARSRKGAAVPQRP